MCFVKFEWCKIWVKTFVQLKLVSILLFCKRIYFGSEFIAEIRFDVIFGVMCSEEIDVVVQKIAT